MLFRPQTYQIQVAGGVVCALLLAFLRHGTPSKADIPTLTALEALAFGLCCIGIVAGGRAVRTRFSEVGSSKSKALADPAYLRFRFEMQVTAMFACAAIASLFASRNGLNPLHSALAALALMGLALPLINRATGWRVGRHRPQ
jgi:cytochrome bd-type quinol oxidase subunit 1